MSVNEWFVRKRLVDEMSDVVEQNGWMPRMGWDGIRSEISSCGESNLPVRLTIVPLDIFWQEVPHDI